MRQMSYQSAKAYFNWSYNFELEGHFALLFALLASFESASLHQESDHQLLSWVLSQTILTLRFL